MTAEQLVISGFAGVTSAIASGLTYIAISKARWIKVKGTIVESTLSNGEDLGYVRKVRYRAGSLGDRVTRPLQVPASTAEPVGSEVDLLHHPTKSSLVMQAEFPAWKAAAVVWAATAFLCWTITRTT